MKSIVVSKLDPAGMLMHKLFLEEFGFKESSNEFDGNPVFSKGAAELVLINEDQILADYVNDLDTELIVFASKHKAASGNPSSGQAECPRDDHAVSELLLTRRGAARGVAQRGPRGKGQSLGSPALGRTATAALPGLRSGLRSGCVVSR